MSDILKTYGPGKDLLNSAVLADVLDRLGHRKGALPPALRPLKEGWSILGRAVTMSAVRVVKEPEEPYALEMECIDGLTTGDVLVATTNGDRSSALWGELLSTAAQARGAAGAVIDGLTRDAAKIRAMDFPVFAAGFSPLDSKGRLDVVSSGQPIQIENCTVRNGDWVFGDDDGIVLVPTELATQAFGLALEKARGEDQVRKELARGRSLREVFNEFGIL